MANDRFITFFYGQLDGSHGDAAVRQCGAQSAGRDASRWFARTTDRRWHRFWRVSESEFRCRNRSRLQSGDRLVLYTDGVTEAANGEDEEFGDARLIEVLRKTAPRRRSISRRKSCESAGQFCANRWHDDATLLIFAVS